MDHQYLTIFRFLWTDYLNADYLNGRVATPTPQTNQCTADKFKIQDGRRKKKEDSNNDQVIETHYIKKKGEKTVLKENWFSGRNKTILSILPKHETVTQSNLGVVLVLGIGFDLGLDLGLVPLPLPLPLPLDFKLTCLNYSYS